MNPKLQAARVPSDSAESVTAEGDSRSGHRCTLSARVSALLLVGAGLLVGTAAQAAVRNVDQRGLTPGAYTTLTQAAAALQAGDTLSIVPGSGPYRELLDIRSVGTAAAPIIVEGNGEVVTGFDTFSFTWNASTARFEYLLPPPIGTVPPGVIGRFRHLVVYQGQRLLADATTGAITSNFASLSEDGTTLILGDASPTEGWEIGARSAVVRIVNTGSGAYPWHHVYRNLRASGSTNDGFNLHGTGTDLKFENIEGFHNFDEGFSSHDSVHCTVDGAAFWGNDNGLYNQSSLLIAMKANNVRAYANLGAGISMRQGVNTLTNSQAWDNGLSNMALGGTLTSYSNSTYRARWTRPPFVAYQETQGQVIDDDFPYTYDAYWKGKTPDATRQAYRLTGDEPAVLPISKLPPFALPYADWRYIYFTSSQIADPATSGETADPDTDGRSNRDEHLAGTHPLVADAVSVKVSAVVPDAEAESWEGQNGLIQLRRSGPTDTALTVFFSMDGTAVAETDYIPLDNYVEILAGSASADLPIIPLSPGSQTAPRRVVLNVIEDDAYVVGPASGTVVIDPTDLPVVTLTVTDSSSSEVAGEEAQFQIQRSGPVTAALRVEFFVSGSATPDADYPGFGSFIDFAPGEEAKPLVVVPVDDGLEEVQETVTLTLQTSPDYALGGAIATVFIEGLPLPTVTLETTDAAATETPGNTGEFTIRRSSGTEDLTVFFTVGGTASPITDFDAIGNFVVIPAGALSATVVVTPVYDEISESSESVVLVLSSNENYALGTGKTGTVTIANYTPPTLTVIATDSGSSEAPGNGGVFTIMRTGVKTSPLTVFYSLGGTAIAGTDYTAPSGSVEIPIGAGSATVAIQPLADTLVEGAETAVLMLTPDPAYVVGGSASATVNITDVPPPTITLVVNDSTASESGGNTGTVTISRTGPKTAALTVTYALSGTATPDLDYTDPGTTLVIPAGSSNATVTITPLPDLLTEPSESVTLELVAQEHYFLGTVRSGTVNISNVVPATVSLSVNDGIAGEVASDDGSFVLGRTGGTGEALSVGLVIGGTATQGLDYTPIVSPFIIPAGSASVIVTVTALEDAETEDAETVTLNLAPSETYLLDPASSGTVTITDAAVATVTLTVADANASETPDDPGSFLLARSGSTASALTVNLSIGGTATSGTDYTALPSSVVIPAGADSVLIAVSPLADVLSEPSETVVLTIAEGAGYHGDAASSGAVTIANVAPPTVSLIVTDASASEAAGNGGLFTISRTGDRTAALTVHFMAGGTATAGTDYTAFGSSVVIEAGASSASVAVTTIPDALVEGTETVVLTISSGDAYLLASNITGSVNIADVALPTVSLVVNDSSASETGGNTGLVTISRTGSKTAPLMVAYTLGGTATPDLDYTSPGSSVVIPAGASNVQIPITPRSDLLSEPSESVTLQLVAQSNYALGTSSSGTVNINDVAPVSVSLIVSDGVASESGADDASFQLSRTGSTGEPLSVSVLIGGSATQGIDYTPAESVFVIPAGSASRVVTVTAISDEESESIETVTLNLAASETYLLDPATSGTLTITDAAIATVTLSVIDAIASEAPDNTGSFLLSRSGSTAADLSVNLAFAGTASNGADYTALPSAVVIPAGAVSVLITIAPMADVLTEPSETAVLTIAEGAGYHGGSPASGTLTIANVAPPTVNLITNDGSASEAPGNGGLFTISRTGAKTAALTVRFSVSGSAEAGADYTNLGSSVVIPAGAGSVTVAVTTMQDALVEGTETVVLSVTAGDVYLLGGNSSGTVNIADVPLPTISIVATDSAAREGNEDAGSFTISRTGARTLALTVVVSQEGSAVAGEDYTAIGTQVTIPAGAGSVVVPVVALIDGLPEGSETLVLRVVAQSNYVPAATASATVMINDAP